MKIKFLFFFLLSTLISSAISADVFNIVATVTVNTEAGIKRYKSHDDIGTNLFSGSGSVVKHSDETKPGEVTIEFINYTNSKTETSYEKLLSDLSKANYRAATIQELCSVQTGVKEINQTELYCFGTEIYLENGSRQLRSGIYKVNVSNNSDVTAWNYSDTMLVPGFVIAAVKIK